VIRKGARRAYRAESIGEGRDAPIVGPTEPRGSTNRHHLEEFHVSIRSAAIGVAGALLITASAVSGVAASSHREAPLIAGDPGADNTDLYAFVSPDDPSKVTIIANYIPLEEPAGGPNFNSFDDSVLYAIHIDNNGDARDDVSFQFRFKTHPHNAPYGGSFLYNVGPIDSLTDSDWLVPQTYSVTQIKNGVVSTLTRDGRVPPVNIGPRSTPNYENLAASAVKSLAGGIKTFAGQRDDAFFVDLGSIFDLGGLRPFNNAHLLPMDPAAGVDGVGGFNTHAIAIQVPISTLRRDAAHPVIGVWASASRRMTRVMGPNGKFIWAGPFRQVSRLGNPLVNEVIIPRPIKDYWNSQSPANDAQFLQYYRSPELASLINILYPSLPDARTSNRDDLVGILLTGLDTSGVPALGVNYNSTGSVKADMLRLNTSFTPNASTGGCYAGALGLPSSTPASRLGVLEGDLCGFPNGRRLADDVTDIELRAVADGYGSLLNALLGLPNNSPNNLVGDGVNENDQPFLSGFPYEATPWQGYEHEHHPLGPTPV
jgi:hypothetical protein